MIRRFSPVAIIACLVCWTGVSYAAKPNVPGMALIPAGAFVMGSNKVEDDSKWKGANTLNPYGFNEKLYVDEHPAHEVKLPAFFMDIYEVTNAQYKKFTAATHHRFPLLWQQDGYNLTSGFLASLPLPYLQQVASDRFKLDMDVTAMSRADLLSKLNETQAIRDKLPVTTVSWGDADAYCKWAKKHLPSEAEWEKAARGPESYTFPWGNTWDPNKINTMSEDPEAPFSPVGSYPGDKSYYGMYDMAANVSEWVADWYDAYPGAPPSKNKFFGKKHKVTRGGITSSGHYDALSLMFRASRRAHLPPGSQLNDLGFRCAKNVI